MGGFEKIVCISIYVMRYITTTPIMIKTNKNSIELTLIHSVYKTTTVKGQEVTKVIKEIPFKGIFEHGTISSVTECFTGNNKIKKGRCVIYHHSSARFYTALGEPTEIGAHVFRENPAELIGYQQPKNHGSKVSRKKSQVRKY